MIVRCVGTNFSIEFEENEPTLRSCVGCNGAHDHLMNTASVHLCYSCGRYWINGKYFTDFETDADLLEHFKKCVTNGCSVKIVEEQIKGDEKLGVI